MFVDVIYEACNQSDLAGRTGLGTSLRLHVSIHTELCRSSLARVSVPV